MAKVRERKVYSFKSVGEFQRDFEEKVTGREDLDKPPIGIKTPMELGEKSLFSMHTEIDKTISDNLRNLILTNHGERLGMYDFGANLMPLSMEFGTDNFDSQAIGRISNAVLKYMPFVSLGTFESFTEKIDNKIVAKGGIRITYTVPNINSSPRMLEIIVYSGA
ncbi:hypothetical protein [Limnobacter sp.]|uniref:hypothetical protein n=1 Tax=Limnobacter sp. TaxID=2003368 RepID=UPI00311FFE40